MVSAGTVRQIVCASPGYLAANRPPSSPEDITKHQTITFARSCEQVPWAFQGQSGGERKIAVWSKILLNTGEGALDATLCGNGLCQFYSYQAAPHIAAGDLEIVLEDFEIDPPPVMLIFPQSEQMPQKLSAFADFALPKLRQELQAIARCCGS